MGREKMRVMNSLRSRIRRTSKSDRQNIISMWQGGCSTRDISRTTGISVSTIHRWIRRWRNEGTVETRKYYSTQWTTPLPTFHPCTQAHQTPYQEAHSCSLPLFYRIRFLNTYGSEYMPKGMPITKRYYLYHYMKIPPFCKSFLMKILEERKVSPTVLPSLCVPQERCCALYK